MQLSLTDNNINRIKELEKLIKKHNKKYFVENDPEISDEEFDKLTQELTKLAPNSPVLYEIVGEIGEIEHPTPMLSLDKRFTHEDIVKWVTDVNDKAYLVEPKYDGMAARYQNGILATRGNGHYGEDISKRLPYLNVIGTLPKDNIAAYGEIIIPTTYFQKHLSKVYKNPRNAVVGIIKAKEISKEGILALKDGGVHFVLHDQAKALLVKPEQLIVEEQWEELLEEMYRSDYPLDGIVIKAIDKGLKRKLGTTSHHNKWEIAYKSPAERKFSKVIDIKDQVGRMGRVTSVAMIEPIELSGATVTNVTLHNYLFVLNTGINIGSTVEVCRSGEVIPFITKVIPANIPHNSRSHTLPTHCPVCNTKLVTLGKYLECPNPSCPARQSQSIEYFFNTLGVEDLGLKTIVRFINELNVNSVVDFYKLNPGQISQLEGFGDKSAYKIVQNIQATLYGKVTQWQLLQALGIKEVGPATSKWIINQHGFDNLPFLKIEDLENIRGIGPVKAQHFLSDLKIKWPIVKALQKMGLKFKATQQTNKLRGVRFAITGKKGRFSREELIKMLEENGAEYKSSISKDLDYLIAGEDAGSKLQKAKDFGIKVIDEDEFLSMIK